MHIRLSACLTDAFSRKWENLSAALALHFAWYTFFRPHAGPQGGAGGGGNHRSRLGFSRTAREASER